ncbi:hypothetical protein JCM11491_001137 [Sporobolomyces phaffii]
MTEERTSSTTPAFDGALAGTLLPRLHHLAHLATTAAASAVDPASATTTSAGLSDVEARAAKLELNKQASEVRASLARLDLEANHLEAGELSLDDQDWLIDHLERELESKREELAKLVNHLTAFGRPTPPPTRNDFEPDEPDRMQTE